ncbi:MAG: O-antigen ligase family protein [Roseiflexaceae bacterium]
MVNFAVHIQRYQWPLIGLALIMVQSMPLAVKVIGVIGLCVIAVTNHAVLLIVVAATTPLYLMPVTLTDTAAIPLHEIVWGIAVLAWVGTRWWQQQPIVAWMHHDRWVGALLGCAVLAVLWALPEGRGEALRWLRWLFVEPIIWYLCVRTAMHHRILHPRQLIQGMMISAGAVAGIGMLQALGYDIVPLLGQKRAFSANIISTGNIIRVASVYGHPNNLALFLERIWPFAFIALLVPQLRSRAIAVVGILCAIGLLLSFSRGAWLAAGCATLLIAIRYYGTQFIRQQPRIVFGLVLVALSATLVALLTRGASVGSIDARMLLWYESITWLQQRPWGLGLGQFYFYHNPEYGYSIIDASLIGTSEQYAAHPHNLILDIWLNLGLWGVVVVAVLVGHALRRSLSFHQPTWWAVAAGMMLITALIHGLVDQFYFVSDIAYCLWCAFSIIDVDTSTDTPL